MLLSNLMNIVPECIYYIYNVKMVMKNRVNITDLNFKVKKEQP